MLGDGGGLAPELVACLAKIELVRRRAFTNRFLSGFAVWSNSVLLGLIVILAISPLLSGPLLLGVVSIVFGLGISAISAWRSRPSPYEAACGLDRAAKLDERISTALHYFDQQNPTEIILRQRADALARMRDVMPGLLFPVRLPLEARRTALLGLLCAVLLGYRSQASPPLLSLLERIPPLATIGSVFSPVVHAMDKPEKSLRSPEGARLDRASGAKSGLKGTEQSSSREETASERRQGQAPGTGEKQAPEQSSPHSDRAAAQSSASEQQQQEGEGKETESQSQKSTAQENSGASRSGNQSSAGQGQRNEERSATPKPSLAQTIVDAVKNLLSNSRGRSRENSPQSSADQQTRTAGGQQSSKTGEPKSESASSGQNRSPSEGNSSSAQQEQKNASNGVGNEPGNDETANNPALDVNLRPERVSVKSTPSAAPGGTPSAAARGEAKMFSSPGLANEVTEAGSGQEEVPLRYRDYLQRYFTHAEKRPQR